MSQGRVIAMQCGKKNPNRFYIQLKNGAVYRYPRELTLEKTQALQSSIESMDCRVKLKYWEQVRKSDGTLVKVS